MRFFWDRKDRSPACEFGARPFPAAGQLAAATVQRTLDRRGEQQSRAAFHLSFTDPVVHHPQPRAATAGQRWRLLRGRGWHPGIGGAAAGGGALPPSAPAGTTTPHLQAAASSRPYSSSLAAHGEEGDCAGKCLQGVCGGAAAGCGAWPPSAPAAAEDALTYARGDLGGGRPQHRGARPSMVGRSRLVGRPPATAPTCCCLQAQAWCFFRGRRTPTLRHRRYGSSFPPCHRRGRTA